MSGKPYVCAQMSMASDADANNLENQRRVLGDCEQVFEDVGSGASGNRPALNRLKAALQPGDCVKVAALDRLGRSLTEVLEVHLGPRGDSADRLWGKYNRHVRASRELRGAVLPA